MKRTVVSMTIVCLALATLSMAGRAFATNGAGDQPDRLVEARAQMRAGQYGKATKSIERILADTGSDRRDEAAYLGALALYYNKAYADAAKAADAVPKDFPKSQWNRKARFLKARCLVELKEFEKVEAIYEDEARRLLSEERKHDVAGVIIGFADELATVPDSDELDAPPPNFAKAATLYGRALEMEIGRALRDEVMFKQARALQQAGNHGAATEKFRAYLKAFDPPWADPAGLPDAHDDTRSDVEQLVGSKRVEARYRLAETLVAAGNMNDARREIEDLLSLAGKEDVDLGALRGDAMWLVVKSYCMPRPSPPEAEAALKATREFTAAHPRDRRAVRAAFLVPEALRSLGRTEDAIQAYRDYSAGKGFRLPPGDAADLRDDETAQSPAETYEAHRKVALFHVGQLLFAQGKHDEAIETWQQYVTQFPNGPHWSACQQNVLHAEFQKGLGVLAEKRYDEAELLLRAFLKAHPLDGRASQILFTFGQIYYTQAQELEKAEKKDAGRATELFRAAIAEWDKLVAKYPGTDQSSLALYRIGLIHEEKLGDPERALECYRKLNWGAHAAQARQRAGVMTSKQLSLSTERKFRCDEPATVRVSTRNIKKLTVRQYVLDLEAYFRKTHGAAGVENLDIALIEPTRTWEADVKEFVKCVPIEQDLEIPFDNDQPGVCIVNVSEEDWEATTLVIRSDLDLIFKSSRREGLVFVQDMPRGKPAAGVKLLLSDGTSVFATGTTGPDGVFRKKCDELKDIATVRVFASRDGHVASHNVDLAGLGLSTGLAPRGYIYTDRPAYQPGEEVSLRGIIRDVRDGVYTPPEGETFVVTVSDPQGRMLRREEQTLSAFGTFHTRLVVPPAAPVGQYAISVASKREEGEALTFTASFQVQTFKLEKIDLTLTFDRRIYFRGEQVAAELGAAYYWGEPLPAKPIRYTLPDGRSFVRKTDDAGKLKITFDTTGMVPGAVLWFEAQIEGENVKARDAVALAQLGYTVAVEPNQPVALAGEPFDVTVTTTGADGKPVGRDLTLFLIRHETSIRDDVLAMVPWLSVPERPPAEVTVQEIEINTDPNTGRATQRISVAEGGQHILRVAGQDRFDQTVTGQSAVLISDEDDAVKLRMFAKTGKLAVGGEADLQLYSRLDGGLALITHEGEDILHYAIKEIRQGQNDLGFEVGHEHFPNFRVAAVVMDGRELRAANKFFTVERELKVEVRPVRDAFEPGAEGEVELTVTDQLGRPVKAELSLALVDEGLFAVFADSTPDIRDFFQKDAHRHAEFRMASTCGFSYAGATKSVLKEAVKEADRVVRSQQEVAQLEEVSQAAVQRLVISDRQAGAAGWDIASRAEQPAAGPASQVAADHFGLAKPDGTVVNAGVAILGDRPVAGRLFRGRDALKSGVGGRLGRAQPQPRRELGAPARFYPAIRTDAKGKATVTIAMPEKTTRWRLTARGCTVETLVGEATAQTLTRKDFFVELKTPSFARQGDSIRPLVRLHNMTDYAGPVEVRLTASRAGSKDAPLFESKQTITVKGQAGGELTFDAFEVPDIVGLQLEVKATAGDHSDALAVDVRVQPWGLEYAAHGGGVANADAALLLSLPDSHTYSSRRLTVTVGPSLTRAVVELALRNSPGVVPGIGGDRLSVPTGPWGGCGGSELLAAASGLEYAGRVQAPTADHQRLAEQTQALVTALTASQREDGGWPWVGDRGASDWAASSRAYWALAKAKALAIAVDADTMAKAKAYLETSFRGFAATDSDPKAVVLHALSVSKSADFANCNRLYRERNSLGSPALAYLTLAFINLGREDFAAELLDILETRGLRPPDSKPQLLSWEAKSKHAWLQDPVEATALVLLALAQLRPDAPGADAAAAWLLDQRGCFGFSPAKARGPAVAALAAHYGRGKHAATDCRIAIRVNGNELAEVTSRGEQAVRVFNVPAEWIKEESLVELKMSGRGEYTYAATLHGFSSELKDPLSWSHPYLRGRHYYHAPLEYRGRRISAGSTSPVKNLESGQRTAVLLDFYERHYGGYLVVEDHLPAGAMLVEGSLTGNFKYWEVRDGKLSLYYSHGEYIQDVRYELVGYAPGSYRALPVVMRDAVHPHKMRVAGMNSLTVLPPGTNSPDPYQMNLAELYALGSAHFEDGLYNKALEYLAKLFRRQRTYNEQQTARMLLWIHTSPGYYDAGRIVEMFEVLRERYPDLEIPFDKILVVGNAYRDIGEFERAWLVFRATIEASFVSDSGVSAVLEDQGRFLGSIDYQEAIWREYPDSADVTAAYFALPQALWKKAPQAPDMPKEGNVTPDKVRMLDRASRMMEEFLTLYPDDPLADDAAYSLASVLLDLKNYPTVTRLSRLFAERYADSELKSSFQYMTGLGLFWQRDYDGALDATRIVADGNSPDRNLARYILGQVYHAQSKPAEAIEWYEEIKEQYPDAAASIRYFENKAISLPEVTFAEPGEAVEPTLTYRNIREAFVQVYRVDLMKLYLREKNLSKITEVKLAGIEPETELTLTLGDGRDYMEKETSTKLPIKEEGAYLVICRGDDLFTSGLVLITPLKIEVQEDAKSGQVRANVLDKVEGGYRAKVHVKVIGSADSEFRSGDTDLRGIFAADNVRGKATVIAREGESRYAFYRGEQWLGRPKEQAALSQPQPEGKASQTDYLENVRGNQMLIQGANILNFEQMRRQTQKGVQVRKAF